MFNGVYVTKDVDQGYLYFPTLRNDDAKAVQRQNEVENLNAEPGDDAFAQGAGLAPYRQLLPEILQSLPASLTGQLFNETTHCRHQRCQRRDLWRALITGSARCHRSKTHLVMSQAARQTLSLETDFSRRKCRH